MYHLYVAQDGTETMVEYTEEEIKLAEKNKKAASIELAKEAKEAAAKETARVALLDKLGITADEAKLLLG